MLALQTNKMAPTTEEHGDGDDKSMLTVTNIEQRNDALDKKIKGKRASNCYLNPDTPDPAVPISTESTYDADRH